MGRIAAGWIFTLPAAAIVGGLAAALASTSTIGLIVVAVLALLVGGLIAVLARRHPVTHENVNDVPETADAGSRS